MQCLWGGLANGTMQIVCVNKCVGIIAQVKCGSKDAAQVMRFGHQTAVSVVCERSLQTLG